MQRLLTILFFVITLPCSYGQLVPSSCSAPQGIVDIYSDDADRMAVREVFRNNSTWQDSIRINPALRDTLLGALLAVYNAAILPARDTVISLTNIHTWRDYVLKEFFISADTGLVWVQGMINGNIGSISPEVDSLVAKYSITLDGPIYVTGSQHVFIELKTLHNHNLIPIVTAFDTLPGVRGAELSSILTRFTDIRDSIHDEYIELIYSYGWYDCISGCKYTRYWQFRVHPGCMVEYVGSYGDIVPADLGIEDEQEERFTVSPNPFTSHINVTGVAQESSYVLYNTLGQKVQSGDMSEGLLEMDSGLPPGSYFLSIRSGTGEGSNFHLIKN